MPQKKTNKSKKRPANGLSQEERRRKAANQPLGGGGPPQGYKSRSSSDYQSSYNSRSQRITRNVTIIMAIIMLVALLGSLLAGCLDRTATAQAAGDTPSYQAAPTGTLQALVQSASQTGLYINSNMVRGNKVNIDHNLGVLSLFFHLSQLTAKKDTLVNLADLLVGFGNAGRSPGSQLDRAVRVNGITGDPRLSQKQVLSR